MIYEAKNRLHFALSSGTSLIPSNLLLDTQSTLGHHNSLKKESSDLKHRVNKSVNLEMKSVGVRTKKEIHQRLTGRRLKSLVRPRKEQAAERQKNRKHVLNLLTADDNKKHYRLLNSMR